MLECVGDYTIYGTAIVEDKISMVHLSKEIV